MKPADTRMKILYIMLLSFFIPAGKILNNIIIIMY